MVKLHSFGPYGNAKDKLITQFVGVPLISLKCCLPPTLQGDGNQSSRTSVESGLEPHQESWPSNVVESVNKENINFNRNVGFVCGLHLKDIPLILMI